MPINLDESSKAVITSQGGVTVSTAFTGELTGDITNGVTLASLRGTPISSNAIQDYEGYLKLDGELKPTRLVYQTLPTDGGNVQGNFDEGLNLKSIYGSGLVDGQLFANDGEGLTYRGGELYPTQLNPHRELTLTTGEINAQHRDKISVDCTLDTTIALPATPNTGDYIEVSVIGGDPNLHPVTFGASHNIEGDTMLFQLDRAVSIRITFNGTKWRVTR